MAITGQERVRRLEEETAKTIEERKEATVLMDKLAAKGVLAVYGGGTRSKGYGFWLYRSTPEAIARFRGSGGYSGIEGTLIQNDGKASGNPAFTMFEDAAKLIQDER